MRGSTHRDTWKDAESHFAADGDRSVQSSNVRDVTLENIVATAVCLWPFAISEGVPCRWSGIQFGIGNHVRDKHSSEKFKEFGESEWIRLSLSVVQTYQRAIFTLDKLFSKISQETRLVTFLSFHVRHKKNFSGCTYHFKN